MRRTLLAYHGLAAALLISYSAFAFLCTAAQDDTPRIQAQSSSARLQRRGFGPKAFFKWASRTFTKTRPRSALGDQSALSPAGSSPERFPLHFSPSPTSSFSRPLMLTKSRSDAFNVWRAAPRRSRSSDADTLSNPLSPASLKKKWSAFINPSRARVKKAVASLNPVLDRSVSAPRNSRPGSPIPASLETMSRNSVSEFLSRQGESSKTLIKRQAAHVRLWGHKITLHRRAPLRKLFTGCIFCKAEDGRALVRNDSQNYMTSTPRHRLIWRQHATPSSSEGANTPTRLPQDRIFFEPHVPRLMAPPADGRLPNSNGASSNGVKLQRFYDGEKGSTSNAHRHDFLEGPFAHDLRAETPPRLYSTSTSAHSSPALFPTTPNRLSLSKRDAVESEISRRSPLEGCLKCFGRVDIAVGEPRILRVSEPMVYDPPRRAAFQGPRDPSLWGSHDHGPMAIHRLRASTRRIDVQPSSAQQISEHEELLSAARHSDSSLDGNGPTTLGHHSRHIRTTTETVSNSPGSDYLVSKHPSARVSPSSAPSAPFSPLSFGELSGGRDHFRNRPTPWDSRPESPPSAFTPDELRLLTPTRSRSEPDLTNLRSPDWGSRVPEGTKQLLSPLDRADPNSPRSAVPHIHKRQLVFAPTSTTGGKVQRRSNPDHFPLNRRHGDVTAPLEPRGPPYAVLADEILDVAGIATRKKPPHIADRFKKLKRTVSGCFGGSCGSPESTATSSATLLSKSKKIEPKQLVGKRRYTWASQYASPGVPSTPLKGEAKLKEDLRLHSLAMRNLDKELYAKFGIAPKDGTSFGSPLQAGRGWIGSPPSRLDSPRRSDGSISSISSTDWHTPKFKPSTVPSTPQRLNEPELAPELTRQFSTSSGSSAEDAKELRRILGNLPEKAHLSALHSLGASSPPPRKISTGW